MYNYWAHDSSEAIEHHGIKGQKWGVRRYQYEDGSLTEEGRRRYLAASRIRRAAKTRDYVEDIVKSFTPEQRKAFGMRPDEIDYLSIAQGEYVLKRFLKTDGDTPVAFLDVLNVGDGVAAIALGTRAGYGGRGYATELGKKAARFVDTNTLGINTIEWSPYAYNTASRRAAEKSGFVLDPQDANKVGEQWITYSVRRKRK